MGIRTRKRTRPKPPTMSLGDALDRHTILTRKIYFGMEDAISEHRYLEQSLAAWGIDGKLITNIIRLAMMNFEIWNLEHEIRMKGEAAFSKEEIGDRALKIRDLNGKRIHYKNKVNDLVGHFKEFKVNHRSQ